MILYQVTWSQFETKQKFIDLLDVRFDYVDNEMNSFIHLAGIANEKKCTYSPNSFSNHKCLLNYKWKLIFDRIFQLAFWRFRCIIKLQTIGNPFSNMRTKGNIVSRKFEILGNEVLLTAWNIDVQYYRFGH